MIGVKICMQSIIAGKQNEALQAFQQPATRYQTVRQLKSNDVEQKAAVTTSKRCNRHDNHATPQKCRTMTIAATKVNMVK